MNILGISAYYHDSAACLVQEGRIIAAAQEERFSRIKHDPGFPVQASRWCLEQAGLTVDDIDLVVYYEKPFIRLERLLETWLSYAPRSLVQYLRAMPVWMKEKLWIREVIARRLDYGGQVAFCEHHMAHAAAAFYPSPFERAAVLTIDGVGEWATSCVGWGDGNRIELEQELRFPHSLGLLYSAFTYFCGFRVNSGEYKLMGLAPYGEPSYRDRILDELVDIRPDGSFRLNLAYFSYPYALTMTGRRFAQLFGGPPRQPEAEITRREMDLARSIQDVTEDIVLKMARHAQARSGMKRLCLSGGVALNCVANGRLLREGPFDDIWIQPAAGDAGSALGAALYGWYRINGSERLADGVQDQMSGALLGPQFDRDRIEKELASLGAIMEELPVDDLVDRAAAALERGKVVGWFQGRMEFGPRALGNRTILADPRDPDMQRKLNLKVKFREGFRPFAPAVLEEKAKEWFQLCQNSPYMLLVAQVADSKTVQVGEGSDPVVGFDRLRVPRSLVPAVTHVDGSARVQTVSRETNPLFHRLLSKFEQRTGCPVLINTSFNVRGEPIVCLPEEAYRCFMNTDIDCLAIGPFWLEKDVQPAWERKAGPVAFD